MATPVLLVHGAWAKGWAWGFVQAELEKRGVTSTTVDLPSADAAPSTMADDAAAIRDALAALDAPAVLVGHSYAGVPVTEASAGNDRVAHLVYVCAVLPEEGQSTGSLMGEDPSPSRVGEAIQATDDGLSTLSAEGAKEILFNDVSQETADPIIAALGTHRLSVFGEAPTALGWKEHPSTYVLTTQDLVFSPALQRRMSANAGTVVEVDAGHIPQLSRAAELADVIAAAAGA
ncbi:alpha/beta hydrolase [Miltoncostaea oceani]|uniref:alpha/beta hydrolase n=1 Tax=Miltoncostaea oceani TaxID=2843216 RepID=UPI001C3E86AC|nr:alpha/beta hydrolase [Miltoncostaea oceani]